MTQTKRPPTIPGQFSAPPVGFDDDLNSDLSGGMRDHWFGRLSPEDKDACLQELLRQPALLAVADRPHSPEKGGEDSDMPYWSPAVAAIARSGAPHAYEIGLEWSRTSKTRFSESAYRTAYRSYLKPYQSGITIGKIIRYALDTGWDADPWRAKAGGSPIGVSRVRVERAESEAAAENVTPFPSPAPKTDSGGGLSSLPPKMPAAGALGLLNSHLCRVHRWGLEGTYAQIYPNGKLVAIKTKDLKESLANRFVELPDGKTVNAFNYWDKASKRKEYDEVLYDPEDKHRNPSLRQHNLWRGFAVQPRKGNCLRMLRHLWLVASQKDPVVFRYFVRWLAHAVQHPGTSPYTIVVLKSETEGTGKTTILKWMRRIFGDHGWELSSPEHLIGRFNDHLESLSFIGLNEPTFAGDKAANRKLKSMITEDTWTIEPKNRKVYSIENIAHIMFTTNERWAIPAGAGARRYLVLECCKSKAGDKGYFKELWNEVDNGGLEAFLYFLQRVDLKRFNPQNDLPRTNALQEQQLLSTRAEVKWVIDLIERGLDGDGTAEPLDDKGPAITFGSFVYTSDLYQDYKLFARDHRIRHPMTQERLGKYLKALNLTPSRARSGSRRGRGYDLPEDPKDLRKATDAEAGIRPLE